MSRYFKDSGYGRQLMAAAGMLRPMKLCTFGTSQMTWDFGFGAALQYALARHHDADLTFRHRSVLTSVADATVVANRGDSYATNTAGSAHMIGPQLTQFLADVAAGMRFDILVTDGGLYNDEPNNQAALDVAMARTMTLLDAFFDPAGNNGAVAIVWGTFGKSPTLCQSWANMWRFKEAASNGRIRFIDTAAVLADPANASGTAWAWKNGSGFGGYTTDGTHLSLNGSRAVALPLAQVLRDVCPRTFNWPLAYSPSAYDAANLPWADVLGPGGAMLGTNGLDDSGAAPGTVPGTGNSGLANRWNVTKGASFTITPSITTGPIGERQISIALSGAAYAGQYLGLSYQVATANVNNSVASRKFMMGAEVELAGVTGLNSLNLIQANARLWDSPVVSTGVPADGFPDATSEVLRLRSMCPVAWSGANPTWNLFAMFRDKNPVAGTIKLQRAFLALVEE